MGESSALIRWAIRFESFMKGDFALRIMAAERQSEEDLPRNPLVHEAGDVLEPEFPVVRRMSHQTASLSIQTLQP